MIEKEQDEFNAKGPIMLSIRPTEYRRHLYTSGLFAVIGVARHPGEGTSFLFVSCELSFLLLSALVITPLPHLSDPRIMLNGFVG